MELEDRVRLPLVEGMQADDDQISPGQWRSFITTLNEHFTHAYSVKGAVIDNLVAIASWWTSLLWRVSHFEAVRLACPILFTTKLTGGDQELRKAEAWIDRQNGEIFEPAGLRLLSPRGVALQFVRSPFSLLGRH